MRLADASIVEIVIDSLTFGYASTATTDDIGCLFASNGELACVISDTTSGDPIATANGTYAVNGDQLSRSGNLSAIPGQTLVGGTTIAPMTISAGIVVENTTLNLTINSSGRNIAMTSAFDADYDRGAGVLDSVAALSVTSERNGARSVRSHLQVGTIDGPQDHLVEHPVLLLVIGDELPSQGLDFEVGGAVF